MMRLIFTFILVFLPFSLLAENKISCSYQDKTSRELEPTKHCGLLKSNGLLQLNNTITNNIRWNNYGLDCVFIYGVKENNGWYFVNQKGEGRKTAFTEDNGCNSFENGVVVGLLNGKVIFFNQAFEIVKKTEYIWANNFYNGFSKVCKGVLEKRLGKDEHYHYYGGECGYINEDFQIVIPLEHPHEYTPKPKGL